MRLFAWSLLTLGAGLAALAALYQFVNIFWLAVLSVCAAGVVLSVLTSLVVSRMVMMNQVVADILVVVKRNNPVGPELAHDVKIRKEILTDIGVRPNAPIIATLEKVIAECDSSAEHGRAADPLYQELKRAIFWPAIQSIFWPKFFH
jgi:lysylphosphatidylglycerol synthetase-like protein (DUF2156 family)